MRLDVPVDDVIVVTILEGLTQTQTCHDLIKTLQEDTVVCPPASCYLKLNRLFVLLSIYGHLQYLSEVMARHRLTVNKASRGSLDNLEAEVGSRHELEHHVEHPLAAVGLQQLDDVRVFEHVADGGLPLEVVQAEPGARGELGHIDDLDSELLVGVTVDTSPHHAERTLADDLMNLVDVIEEDLLLI